MPEPTRIVPKITSQEYEIRDLNADGLKDRVKTTRCQWEAGVEYDESSPDYMRCFSSPEIVLSGDAQVSELQRITNNGNMDIIVGQRCLFYSPYDETHTVHEGTVTGFLDFPSHVSIIHGAVRFISFTAQIMLDDGTATSADIDYMIPVP